MAPFNQDYLLICVDLERKYSFRFLCLNKSLAEILTSKKLNPTLSPLLAELVLGSLMIGTRNPENQTSLYKLIFDETNLRMNCEVSHNAHYRCAIFPHEYSSLHAPSFKGEMKVTLLSKKEETYQSITALQTSMENTFREYLLMSSQSESYFQISHTAKSYGLWVEKLPQTPSEEFKSLCTQLKDRDLFSKAIADSDDPDLILKHIFGSNFQILAVLKPQMSCSCTYERFMKALQALPREDLLELFMENQGVTSQCEYCQKIWSVDDSEIKKLLGVNLN